jgi:hypothetical protein
MAKPLPPEVLALIPNGMEHLVLCCTVCRGELPNNRRAYGHHAGACHKVVMLHRRYVLSLTKCPSCLHPASPEERAEFSAWRRARGERGERGGRVPGKEYANYPKKGDAKARRDAEKTRRKREKGLDKSQDDFGTPDIVVEEKTS